MLDVLYTLFWVIMLAVAIAFMAFAFYSQWQSEKYWKNKRQQMDESDSKFRALQDEMHSLMQQRNDIMREENIEFGRLLMDGRHELAEAIQLVAKKHAEKEADNTEKVEAVFEQKGIEADEKTKAVLKKRGRPAKVANGGEAGA